MAKKVNLDDRAAIREACIAINNFVSANGGPYHNIAYVTPDILEPNEMFFITESSLRDLAENGGICDKDAKEVIRYLNSYASKSLMDFYYLGFGYIFKANETEFLMCTNSFDDLTPFLERAERAV